MTKKKESLGLKASEILYVVNALWRKKAMLQILFDWRSCPVGLLCFYMLSFAFDTLFYAFYAFVRFCTLLYAFVRLYTPLNIVHLIWYILKHFWTWYHAIRCSNMLYHAL